MATRKYLTEIGKRASPMLSTPHSKVSFFSLEFRFGPNLCVPNKVKNTNPNETRMAIKIGMYEFIEYSIFVANLMNIAFMSSFLLIENKELCKKNF